MSRDFVLLILIAIVIAMPAAWYTMNRWLEGFAYRIEIEFWVFILAGLAATIIAAMTICFHAIKAARRNPVMSLRSE